MKPASHSTAMRDVVSGSLKSLREGNRDRLIALLREHGSLHRAELARRAGVSRATVSTIVTELLAEGLVVEPDGEEEGAAGTRKRTGLTLNPRAGAVLGLDFSASTVYGVVADLSHEVVAEGARPLDDGLSWMERLDVGVQLSEAMLAEAGIDRQRVLGAGLGLPGPVNVVTGEVGASSRSLRWQGTNPAAQLSKSLGVPVAQDNTAHLGALAEVAWGAARGCQHVIYVKASQGVSAGLVIDGRVFRGALGATGGLGHMSVVPDGLVCSCGSRGCLEMYTAVPAIQEALAPVYGDLTFEEILDLAAQHQRPCLRVLRDAGLALGRGLAGACNLLNPERVVIGGELARAGEAYLDAVREGLEQYALPVATQQLGVAYGELGERAGALGGVALMLREGERTGERV